MNILKRDWRYLTSKTNALFSEKQAFIGVSEEHKKRILTKNSENPDYVAKAIEISNFELIKDIAKVVDFIENKMIYEQEPIC